MSPGSDHAYYDRQHKEADSQAAAVAANRENEAVPEQSQKAEAAFDTVRRLRQLRRLLTCHAVYYDIYILITN